MIYILILKFGGIYLTQSYRTNIFVLCMMLNQIVLLFLWRYIVSLFHLELIGQLIATQLLTFIVPIILFFILTKEPLIKTLRIKSLQFKNIILIIFLSFLIQPFMSFLSAFTAVFFPNEVSTLFYNMRDINATFLIIGMGVAPAICEELFFRGVTFSGYKNMGITKACLTAGFLFGLMHLDGQQFLYAFALGAMFCFLVYKTQSIFSSILAHFTINASQAIMAISTISALSPEDLNTLQNTSYTLADRLLQVLYAYAYFILSLPLLLITIWIFLRVNKNNPSIAVSESNSYSYSDHCEKVFNIPFLFILIIYVFIVFILPML